MSRDRTDPPWSKWAHPGAQDYTVGIEEEVMLLKPGGWALSPSIEAVLAAWPDASRERVSSETHSSAVELRTGVHACVGDAVAELAGLRAQLGTVVEGLGLAAAVRAPTHRPSGTR